VPYVAYSALSCEVMIRKCLSAVQCSWNELECKQARSVAGTEGRKEGRNGIYGGIAHIDKARSVPRAMPCNDARFRKGKEGQDWKDIEVIERHWETIGSIDE
jgi:hypothetical protein